MSAATKRPSFYIIDGHSQIFRAYYAPAAFRNRGKGMGAAYIFARMLLKLLDKGKPDYLVCTLDSKGDGFRHKIFPEYKAHREPMPQDLAEAMPVIRRLIQAMGLPIVEADGFEADDCIGTLAVQAQSAGYDVRMVSRDKDLKQLLGEHVCLFDIDDGSRYGPDELQIDLGLKPAQVIDYLALMGDSVDNIPGAVGVGPKKAQALLAEYGTIEGVLERAGDIKQPKMRDNLLAFRAQAPVSKKLATIVCDVPLDFDLARAKSHPIDKARLLPLLQELGFRGMIRDLGWEEGMADTQSTAADEAPAPIARVNLFGEAEPAARTSKAKGARSTAPAGEDLFAAAPAMVAPAPLPASAATANYTLVRDAKGLKAFLAQLKKHKRFAMDTETTSLDTVKAELVGLSFSWEEGQGVYIAVKGPAGEAVCDVAEVIKGLKPILEDETARKIGQNIKYDMLVLRRYGVEVRGIECDTMVAAYLADNTRQQVSLDQLAQELLGYTCMPITALIGTDKKTQRSMAEVELERITFYAAEDADIALRLADSIAPSLTEQGLDDLARELEMPLVEVLADMEFAGIAIDIPYLRELASDFEKRMEETEQACYRAAGQTFTINSPKQLGEVLFDKLSLGTGRKTAKGARSTAVDVLEALARDHELPRLVLEYRHLSKLKSTYIDALPGLADEHGRVHTTFRQAVATGRLASNDPNVQNIPVRSEEGRKIRKAFIAGGPDKRLIVADYSQIELRILAHLCGDEVLRRAFAEGKDIHRTVAAEVNGVKEADVTPDMRAHVKAINFGILYGQGAFGLSQTMGLPRKEAQDFIDRYFKRFPKVQSYIGSVHEAAIRDGYVTTVLGRRRHIPGLSDSNRMRQSAALRQAFNTVTQGSAADLIKMAMLRVHRRVRRDKLPFQLLIQVHDELLLEAPAKRADEAAVFLKEEMEGALKLDVPIIADVGIGKNWLEAKD